jgi:hypothetical protein
MGRHLVAVFVGVKSNPREIVAAHVAGDTLSPHFPLKSSTVAGLKIDPVTVSSSVHGIEKYLR